MTMFFCKCNVNVPKLSYDKTNMKVFVSHVSLSCSGLIKMSILMIIELRHEKTNVLHMRKQRRRSALR